MASESDFTLTVSKDLVEFLKASFKVPSISKISNANLEELAKDPKFNKKWAPQIENILKARNIKRKASVAYEQVEEDEDEPIEEEKEKVLTPSLSLIASASSASSSAPSSSISKKHKSTTLMGKANEKALQYLKENTRIASGSTPHEVLIKLNDLAKTEPETLLACVLMGISAHVGNKTSMEELASNSGYERQFANIHPYRLNQKWNQTFFQTVGALSFLYLDQSILDKIPLAVAWIKKIKCKSIWEPTFNLELINKKKQDVLKDKLLKFKKDELMLLDHSAFNVAISHLL